jgi:hypothetical protein
MPSEARIGTALEALAGPRGAFLSAVAEADEEIRSARLAADEARDPADALARELGLFARGRIDPARMAGLIDVVDVPDPLMQNLVGVAHDLFVEVSEVGGRGFRFDVPVGGDLREVVRGALADLGRAFGVAHAVEKARDHRYDPDTDHVLLHPYPFHRWTTNERRLAPPLVVRVGGDDLRPGGLSEYLDGAVRIALVVQGPTTPAPLARLIGHGVFVAQTSDPTVLERLAAHPGTGVVALVEAGSGAIEFVHDPSVGDRPWERLSIQEGIEALEARLAQLEGPGRSRVHAADVRHLLELAVSPREGAGTGSGGGAGGDAMEGDDAADRLAAWLLARTDLTGV